MVNKDNPFYFIIETPINENIYNKQILMQELQSIVLPITVPSNK